MLRALSFPTVYLYDGFDLETRDIISPHWIGVEGGKEYERSFFLLPTSVN